MENRIINKMFTLAFAFTALVASSAVAKIVELKFGHVGKPGSLFEASVNEFAKRANAKLAGKAKVIGFGSSQLGKDKIGQGAAEEAQARDGQLRVAVLGNGFGRR